MLKNHILLLIKKLKVSLLDLVPIIVVVVFFQSVVIQQPFPQIGEVLIGVLFVIFGLMLFIEGLEMGLFPIGESLAYALAKKGSLFWLLMFAFALGFSTTIAEPALLAIAKEAASISSDAGLISQDPDTLYNYETLSPDDF